MSPYTIHVSNIAQSTTEQHLHDFFSFCGTIMSIDFKGDTADIHFEKLTAAKTALMLNGGTLDGAHLVITTTDDHDSAPDDDKDADTERHIGQSDKPRAGIAAEYLSKGYLLSDDILKRAIELDQKNGISSRFTAYINQFDITVGEKAFGPKVTVSSKAGETITAATDMVKAVDEQRGISKIAYDYYARALASSLGQKVKAFYTSTSKQVLDVHEEAKRLSEAHKASSDGTSDTPSSTAVGTSAPPLDPKVHPVPTDATTIGGAPKTAEAPTVI